MKNRLELLQGTSQTVSRSHLGDLQVCMADGLAGPRVLLVDDELEIWWPECVDALRSLAYDVHTAENGDAAWAALQTDSYDLLITDNKMPLRTGRELIADVRAHGLPISIIFASSLLPVLGADEEKWFARVRMLEKPVSPSQLLTTIAEAALEDGWPSPKALLHHN